MRILNINQFLELGDEVLFCKYDNGAFGELEIKVGNQGQGTIDFLVDPIIGAIQNVSFIHSMEKLMAAEKTGESLSMDFEYTGRDGYHDPDQKFAVYEKQDIEQLIARLQRCINRS